jgi:dTDP-4-amino-4,6-dideoxygalactose transaminase
MIPFSPPRIDQKTIDEVTDTLKSGWISTGPKTRKFEENLAQYLGADHVVALGSATAGLQLILNWLGIGEGDEVIIPAYTYTATANVVIHAGATPIMVDVNSTDFNINCKAVENAITEKTKVIIPVDIAGMPADYNELYKIVKQNKNLFKASNDVQEKFGRIVIISDSAHSIGATYKGKKAGLIADISSFSFHAVKNLTTAEGGAVVFNVADKFNHEELKKSFKISSLHGQTKDAFSKVQIGAWRYDVIEAGFKCNMTDLQAAIGLVELERYEETLNRRKEIFERYTAGLAIYTWANTPIYETEERKSSFHLYMLRINGCTETQRDTIINKIGEKQVAVNVHYIPLPMLSFYKGKGYNINDYPTTFDNYHNEITLPVWFDLTNEQVDTVIKAIADSVQEVLG